MGKKQRQRELNHSCQVVEYNPRLWGQFMDISGVAVIQPAQERKVKGKRLIGDWHVLGGQCSWNEVVGSAGAALKGPVDHTKDPHHLLQGLRMYFNILKYSESAESVGELIKAHISVQIKTITSHGSGWPS